MTFPPLSRKGGALAAALFCCFLWGSAFPSVKAGLAYLTPTFFAGIRFTLAGLAVLLLAAWRRGNGRPWLVSLPAVLAIGFFQTVLGYYFFFHGLSHSSAVTGSIINSSGPIIVALMAWIFLGEGRWSWPQALGVWCGFAGVMVALIKPGWRPDFSWRGEGAILLSTICLSYASIMVKRIAGTTDVMFISGGSMASGGAVLLALALLTEPLSGLRFSPVAVMIVLYTSFISAAAFSIWYALLRDNPVSTISAVKFTIPITGSLLSAAFLGEELTIHKMVGGALVGLGIYLIFFGMTKETAAPGP